MSGASVTAIRDKDWVFHALWAAGGPDSTLRCNVNVPITILFKHGVPYKGLESRAQNIRRVHLDNHANIHDSRSISGASNSLLRASRSLLIEFSRQSGYLEFDDEYEQEFYDSLICSAVYGDGERENLTLQKFDLLIRNETWRNQLLFLQGYVPAVSTQSGYFGAQKKIRSLLESEGAEAADQYTRALAKFVEKAYMECTDEIANSSALGTAIGKATTVSKIVLKVSEMQATFALDKANRVLFLHPDYTKVEIQNNQREVEEALVDEKATRENAAAESVYNELQALLRRAATRGLSMADSFRHFDTQKTGFVDVDGLMNGMSKLGIGVTYSVGEKVLQTIGGIGSNFLTVLDFDRLIKVSDDIRAFEDGGVGSPTRRRDLARTSSDRILASRQKELSQLLPPPSAGAISLPNTGFGRRPKLPPVNSALNKQDSMEEEEDEFPTDVPHGAQYAAREDVVNATKKTKAPASEMLPPWASKRQKKALKELQNASVRAAHRAAKKQEVDGDLPQAAAISRSKPVAPPFNASSRPNSGANLKSMGTLDLKNLNFQGVSLNDASANFDINKDKDEVLYMDMGLIMAYRVVLGEGDKYDDRKTHENVDSLRYKSILENQEKSFVDEASESLRGAGVDRQMSFTVVILPDLFMTLETLHHNFKKILEKFPHARLILVGFPGLPNTNWPAGWVLNSDLHARSINKLLTYLNDRHDVVKHVGDPIFMMGIGSSMYSLSRYIVNYSYQLGPLRNDIRGIISVNGFIKMNGGIRRIHKELRDAMVMANSYEVNELIVSLHFHDDYLANVGREAALKEFWLTRRGICNYNVPDEVAGRGYVGILEQINGLLVADTTMSYGNSSDVPGSTRSSRKQSMRASTSRTPSASRGSIFSPNTSASARAGSDSQSRRKSRSGSMMSNVGGVVSALEYFDGTKMLVDTNIPIVVIQSTEDVFIDPRNANVFKNDLPENREVVSAIDEIFDVPGAIQLNYLAAGHELIQERNNYVLAMISNLAQLCGIRPVNVEERPKTAEDVDEEIFDVLAMAERRREQIAKGEADAEKLAQMEEEERKRLKRDRKALSKQQRAEEEAERIRVEAEQAAIKQQEEAEASARAAAAAEEEAERAEKEAKEAAAVEEELKRERQNVERDKRAKLAIERKSREMKAARKAEMEVLYESERLIAEKKSEAVELAKMQKEDSRSKHANDYFLHCLMLEKSAAVSKIKAHDLHEYRREEAIKKVEETMAIERAIRLEERRKKAAEVVAQLEAEELALTGEKEGGYDPENPKDVNHVIAATQRLLRDLMECRQRTVEALKKQKLVASKVDLFRKQCSDLDTDVSRLRRAVRLVEINPSLVVSADASGGGSDDFYKNQLEDLRRNLALKEESYLDFLAVKTSREEQLAVANRTVQSFKVKLKEREGFMNIRLQEMMVSMKVYADRIRELKMHRDEMTNNKNFLKIKAKTIQKRLDGVNKEYNRIKDHKGELVDTDVWVEGVLQRAVTKDLKKHLKREMKRETTMLQETRTAFDEIIQKIVEEGDRIALAKRDCDKITLAMKSFQQAYKKISSYGIMDIMNDVTAKQELAEKLQDKRTKDAQVADKIAQMGGVSIADGVRLKDHELRSKDERQFIGLDLVLNPDKYLHLTVTEAEEMQYDEDYQCELTKADLTRILKLPDQINLAVPFLHTEREVQVHRLLNMFYKEERMDDKYFRMKDYLCGGVEEDAPEDSTVGSFSSGFGNSSVSGSAQTDKLVGPADMQDAETIHDILIKESLRDRIRALCEDEPISEDEQAWRQLDKILSPEIYGREELNDVQDNILGLSKFEIDVTTTNNELEVMKNKKPEVELSTTNNLQSVNSDAVQFTEMSRITETQIADIKKTAKSTLPMKILKASDPFSAAKRDGDKYQELRHRFQSGEKVFEYGWRCPFNKYELLDIRTLPFELLVPYPDAVKCRLLMEKYYVDPDESVLGAMRLQTMNEVTKRVNKIVSDADALHAQATRRASLAGGSSSNGRKGGLAMLVGAANLEKLAEMRAAGSVVSQSVLEENEEDYDEPDMESTIVTAPQDDFASNRIWGSWEQVHPASAGIDSQMHLFMPSTYNPARDHPASFAMAAEAPPPALAADLEKLASEFDNNGVKTKEDGLRTLTSLPSEHNAFANDKKSKWFISDSIEELAAQEQKVVKNKVVLIAVKKPMVLLDVKDSMLDARQSRVHRFVVPDKEDARILDITVSIVFQGVFGTKGYKVGRLAAGLFRIPDEQTGGGLPFPIGHSPYNMQSPNLPDCIGRLTILHQPKVRPIAPGGMQIVLGTAAATRYSIEVTARYAKSALPIVDEGIANAKEMQARFPKCLLEIEAVDESLRLAERKLLVCDKMIKEAQMDAKKTQDRMYLITDILEKDDDEMTLLETERKEYQREYDIMEVEYAQFSTNFASRNREKLDIRDGIAMMHEIQRKRQEEKKMLKEGLEHARRDLPACIVLLRNIHEASNVAAALNTTLQCAAMDSLDSGKQDVGLPKVQTPAETCRLRFRREGWDMLILEEQMWIMIDQAMNPVKYEWLREKEEEENQLLIDIGKKPKKKKYNAAVESCRLSKGEIIHIMQSPFSMLNRREITVRKLMTKFHDDNELMLRGHATAAFGFDPHLAERVRAKNPVAYTKEEHEWASIDKILHPAVWKYYVHIDDGLSFLDKDSSASAVKKIDSAISTAGSISQISRTFSSTNDQTVTPPPEKSVGNAQVESVGRILGLGAMDGHAKLHSEGDGVNMKALVGSTQQEMVKKVNSNTPWKCTYTKEHIMRIWRTPRHKLDSVQERHCHHILHKYNGTYSAYTRAENESNAKSAAKKKVDGKHIQWSTEGITVTSDVDLRCRSLLREIDRVSASKNEYMDSDVLHANNQRFPTVLLRIHLEEELDLTLREQIRERERAEKWKVDEESSSSEEDLPLTGPDGASAAVMDDDESEMSDMGDVNDEAAVAAFQARVQKRAKKREKKRRKLKAQLKTTLKEDVFNTRQMLNKKNKSGEDLDSAILLNSLGRGGCLACRSNPCKWKPCVDVEAVTERKKVLDKEMERVRLDRDSHVITSDVCLSAQQGGNRVFKRLDLLDELNSEDRDLSRRLQLNNVDRELHAAYASRSEYIEIYHLHGYATTMWTTNARKALEARQSKLVAMSVVKDVIDSMLEYMLEGWFFGEVQSNNTMIGFVPSVKNEKDGNGEFSMMRPGQDQIQTVGVANARLKARAELKKKGIMAPQFRRGTVREKAEEIEVESQLNLKREKVAKKGSQHEHLLNETESTLRFGLFMLTLMYFRAMTFVRREKVSWSGEGESAGLTNAGGKMTDERMRMMDEESKAVARKKKIDQILARCKVGEQRRKDREAAERKEAILRLQEVIKRQKTETASVCTLQRVYRGHLGRKAAKRWALKRGEIGAMHHLLNSTAICLQRAWRGYLGRELTKKTRREMAYFIALMRQQEAEDDEELYWKTHPWAKVKRDTRNFANKKLRSAHQVDVLGGARLTEEEQQRMLDEAIDENDEADTDEDLEGSEDDPSSGPGSTKPGDDSTGIVSGALEDDEVEGGGISTKGGEE